MNAGGGGWDEQRGQVATQKMTGGISGRHAGNVGVIADPTPKSRGQCIDAKVVTGKKKKKKRIHVGPLYLNLLNLKLALVSESCLG